MPVDKLKKEECCGCNACGDACPTKAITFEVDNEGFWYPKVNYTTCINCELCTKICPEINKTELKHNDFEEPECYAAENKNLEVVFDSTSGGLFSAFADRMYRDGGYVGGAVFSEDYRTVKQFVSPNKSDLPALRSSKYLQSDCQGFYKQVKELLNNGEKVVVCGCPCQMAALRSFLRKPYENLLVLDFICLGINSPLIWQKYLDTFEERYGSKVLYSKSKSKEYGWRNLTHKVKLADGRILYEKRNENDASRGYIVTHSYIRPACYNCAFRGLPRMSDVTLADFWGIEKFDKDLEKDLGTSLVLVNSDKGKEWFAKISKRLNYIPVPLKFAIEGNPAMMSNPSRPTIDREKFFEDVKLMSFTDVAKKYGFSTKVKDESQKSFKRRVRDILRRGYDILKAVKYPPSFYRTLRVNRLGAILKNKYVSLGPYAYVQFEKGSNIIVNGLFPVGRGRFKKYHNESRILVEKGATLRVDGKYGIGNGCDIEVFRGAELIFKGGGGANVNFTCICAQKIEIGRGVMIGRGVTIRDNNGGHYLNRDGYRNSRPVIIEDKAWLCEGCTIMPGVKVGQGAIVGAKALVTSNVPPYTMVFGNPARVVDRDILWKY